MTQEQFINGLANYVREDLCPSLGGSVAVALYAFATMVERDHRLAECIMKHHAVSMIIGEDPTQLLSALEDSVQRFGSFEVCIPKVPLLTNEIKLKFSADDIRRIRNYL